MPTITYTNIPTMTPTITLSPTPEIDYSKVDIFNEATWPGRYKGFWDGGWLNQKRQTDKISNSLLKKPVLTFLPRKELRMRWLK